MSGRSSALSIQESSGSKDKRFRVSSADKKKMRQDRKGSGLKHQTVEDDDENDEIGNKGTGYTQQRVATISRPSSGNQRTPTKRISLEAVPRKPEYQKVSVNSSHQRAVSPIRPTSAPRRTPTPTKQVSLQAIPRKSNNYSSFENSDWKKIIAEQLDDPILKSSVPQGTTKTSQSSKQHQINAKMANSSRRDSSSSTLTCSSNDSLATQSTVSMTTTQKAIKDEKENVKSLPNKSADHVTISDSDEYDTDLDDEETSSEEESDEEPRKAPNELFMEFLACVMGKDYKNAQKLCKMILMYEPNNPEALSFQPLIEYKVQRAEAGEVTSSSDDSDSSSDDEDDDESRESGDESGDESSDSGEESEDGSSSDAEGSTKNSSEDEDDDENAGDDGDSDRVTDSGLGSVTDMTQ